MPSTEDRPSEGRKSRDEEVRRPVGHGRDRHRRAPRTLSGKISEIIQPEDRPGPTAETGDVDDQADEGDAGASCFKVEEAKKMPSAVSAATQPIVPKISSSGGQALSRTRSRRS